MVKNLKSKNSHRPKRYQLTDVFASVKIPKVETPTGFLI
jgi:hypothetical protein